ncbi:hypothetical protein MYCTH_2130164 [Thermothelomyces thermophilus ATCC 42464]|uniref:FAD/NAD(P)-binding domain-containing protein n=1 Tax=Thermothelomyces thermophilus (strain ATCC 42464 / BCRC 31852 / DSM 1799) TaxID=573729 RepID=G2QM41_THET4|nr:uncharacterized protein MYCTH_2130164 [Thermothelomyces thermophilus ATCC 42464]AEO61021.1 hypothetical protein MYCTH_2130164 [Thermothelomyces thermophilus ATCC 42464]
MIDNDVLALNKYDSHPELRKLKPWSPAMFTASSFSILNYPTDIFDLVRDGTIRVHIADLTGLSARTVHLSDGTQLDADALCCVTGWKHMPPVEFLPEGGLVLVDRRGVPRGRPARGDDAERTASSSGDSSSSSEAGEDRGRAEPITTSVVAAADDNDPAYVAIAAGVEAMGLNQNDDDDSGRVGSEMEVDGSAHRFKRVEMWARGCVGEVVL